MIENREKVNELFRAFAGRRINRRQFVAGASALGLSASAINLGLSLVPARAQEATSVASPVTGGGLPGSEPGTRSITRAEYEQLIRAAYPFTEVGNEGGQVIVPEISALQTVNALLASDATSFLVVQQVFEPLIGGSVIDGNPAPVLADWWELADDGVTYTVHLPQNVTWHDGTPFTAHDAKFSYDSILNPALNSQYQASVSAVLQSYEVVDDYTFRLVSVDRIVTFLADAVQTVLMIPRHIWENVPVEQWPNDPGSTGADPSRAVGTGPFRFQASEDNGTILRMVPNETYYIPEMVPHIDEYIIQVFPDTAATIQALTTGAVDIVDTVDFAQVETLRNTEGLSVVTYNTGTFWYYLYQLDPARTTMFQDVQTRQALFYAIDREALVNNLTFGYAVVADGTQPILSYAYAPDRMETIYRYDPERARQLLAEAGWQDTDGDGVLERDGQPFEVEWLSVGGVGEYETMLASIQQWWSDVGVRMQPQFLEFATLLERMDAYDFQIMNLAFTWVPPWDQGPMFRTDEYEGGFNRMKYSNPEFDRLDDLQKRELDFETRVDLLIQQSNIINNDLPVGIILFRDQRIAFQDRLQNYFPSSFGQEWWSMPYVWVTE